MNKKSGEFLQDAPLRLDAALKAAFPAGGLTIAGLRKEIARGRLEVELIAGKYFTTLAAIERMREVCRVAPKAARPTAEEIKGVLCLQRSAEAASAQNRLRERLALPLRANDETLFAQKSKGGSGPR